MQWKLVPDATHGIFQGSISSMMIFSIIALSIVLQSIKKTQTKLKSTSDSLTIILHFNWSFICFYLFTNRFTTVRTDSVENWHTAHCVSLFILNETPCGPAAAVVAIVSRDDLCRLLLGFALFFWPLYWRVQAEVELSSTLPQSVPCYGCQSCL